MTISDEEIDHQLEFLQNYGEIYYVNDWIRITAPEEVTPDCVEKENDTGNEEADTNESGTG